MSISLANADALSRLPAFSHSVTPEPGEILLLRDRLANSPITASHIKQWTDRDPTLSRVRRYVSTGWPNSPDSEDLAPFYKRRDELSLLDGCILIGSRVVVPKAGQDGVKKELHASHMGISKMKGLARAYVWWPHLDQEIESMVQSCSVCQTSRPSPAVAPLHPWEWPERPWARVHIDYAGPFMGKMFLVLVDAHSKWLEAHIVNSATTQATIEKLQAMFSVHGIPEKIVSDNGSAFTSIEFERFVKENGIVHIRSSPYHPASNGLAERGVQTLKQGLQRLDSGSLETKLARFLFKYRLTPHAVTGVPPAELLLGRRPRSRLDLLFPTIKGRVEEKQAKQKEGHDRHSKHRLFQQGDLVFVKDMRGKDKWLAGRIVKALGPVSYGVCLTNGQYHRRHVDHLRSRKVVVEPVDNYDRVPSDNGDLSGNLEGTGLQEIPVATESEQDVVDESVSSPPSPTLPQLSNTTVSRSLSPTTAPRSSVIRRSTREHRPPDRFIHESYPPTRH